MPKHKSEDFKMSAVEYYLTEDVSQEQVCRIFKCSPRSLMRWVEKYENDLGHYTNFGIDEFSNFLKSML
jgi:transposase-like protein